MKTILINSFFIFFFCSLSAFSQKLEISWGESFNSATDVQKILGFSGNKMIAFSSKGKNKFIETYNKSGYSQISSVEYNVPQLSGLESGLLNITVIGDNVFTIVYGFNKREKSFGLYSQKLSLEGKPIGPTQEMYQSGVSDDKIKDRIVDVRFSPDNSKVLVFFDRTNGDRTDFYSDEIIIDLADLKDKPTILKNTYPMRSSKSEAVNFKMYHSIDNEGNNFNITEKIEFTKKVISNFTLSVFGFKANGDKIGEVELADEENVLLSPTIVSNNGKYHVVGYYMTNPKKRALITGYSGLFVADLESDLSVMNFKKSKFEDEFFKDLFSERKIAKMNEKGKEILVPAPYTMDNIILHKDGTMTVLSEYFLVTVTDDGKGSKTTMTNYGSIIYYKLNAEGDILASDVIHKNQVSATSSIGMGYLGVGGGMSAGMFVSFETKDNKKKYWSYAMSYNDDNIFLVFNDHIKNVNDDDDEMSANLSNPSKSIPYLVTINNEGAFTKQGMAESGDTDTYCVPQITYHIDEENFIIWGVRRKENKFGVATIK